MIALTDTPKKILVTGSSGAIGRPVCQHLIARGHTVRGFDLVPTPELDDCVVADLVDGAAVLDAAAGVDTILHLGAYPNPADFVKTLLGPNVIGLYNVCEAAREVGVERLVLASSVQTISGHDSAERTIRVEDGPRPTNHYALTKVWAEAAGELYARCHSLSVISVRIGWLPRNFDEAKELVRRESGPDFFLSHADAQRFFERCVESTTPARGESAILFATSKPLKRERLDLAPAHQLIGYEPQNVWPEGLPFSVDGL